MRTTIEIPDDLFRQAKIRAIQEGVRLKELFARYVAQGLSAEQSSSGETTPIKRKRSDLPIASPATGKVIPHLTNAQMYHILENEETEPSNASAG